MNPQQACGAKDEWFTPPFILAKVRATLGEVRYDLASCADANASVGAQRYFSKEYPFQEHHEAHEWQSGFWCNPPFSQCKHFAPIIASEAVKGIVLTNANTSAKWWQTLARSADAVQFLGRRISFINPATGAPVRGNPKGQSLFFLGCSPDEFQGMGVVMSVR